jgi:hypothetical protein
MLFESLKIVKNAKKEEGNRNYSQDNKRKILAGRVKIK